MQELVKTNEAIASTVKTTLGTDLNYTPFSSWYGKVTESMESHNFITESLFFQALEHIGAISRRGSQTLPPNDIYEVMKGLKGTPKVEYYCKKNSNIAGHFIESYGICLDELHIFEDKYLASILSILNSIELGLTEEFEESQDYATMKKSKSEKGNFRRINAKAKKIFEAGKEDVIREAFKADRQ